MDVAGSASGAVEIVQIRVGKLEASLEERGKERTCGLGAWGPVPGHQRLLVEGHWRQERVNGRGLREMMLERRRKGQQAVEVWRSEVQQPESQ